MLQFGQVVSSEERSALQTAYIAKKEFLSTHMAHLYANTNPADLWNAIVKYRSRSSSSPAPSSVSGITRTENNSERWGEMYLTYDDYHKMVFELLFNETASGNSMEEHADDNDNSNDSNTINTTPYDNHTKRSELTEKEKERRKLIYFNHPFLSPATFLAFSRNEDGTVPAVPLYAFAAKRLLLFRLRVELELVASAMPPFFLRDNALRATLGNKLPCAPSTSSPLSNGLTQDDIETFINNLIPNLRLVRDIPPWMLPYYLCHASRKFMFMCDVRNVGSLSIDTTMKSEVFSELLRMFESDARDAVITFPVGCPVEVSATWINPQSSPEDTTTAFVLHYENDGNDLTDVYELQLADYDNGNNNNNNNNTNDSSITTDSTNMKNQDGVIKLPRSQIYWSSAAEEYIASDVLCMDNWFSMALMARIYEHFTTLDVDEDGVLTPEELSHYSSDSFTQLAIKRVFECHVPQTSPRHIMDYKTYLNFVVATEHAVTRPAMRYIWQMLDLDGTHTYINLTTLHCFCKELAKELVDRAMMNISSQSILSEIVDMINPEHAEYITFDDIERSGHQATVLPILLNYRNFYAYDCREQTAASANDEYTSVNEHEQ